MSEAAIQKHYGTVPRPPGICYWICRDASPDNELHGWVSVWSIRPMRVPYGDGAYWRAAADKEPLHGFIETLWLAECWKKFNGAVPETSLECIRVERATEIAVTPR